MPQKYYCKNVSNTRCQNKMAIYYYFLIIRNSISKLYYDFHQHRWTKSYIFITWSPDPVHEMPFHAHGSGSGSSTFQLDKTKCASSNIASLKVVRARTAQNQDFIMRKDFYVQLLNLNCQSIFFPFAVSPSLVHSSKKYKIPHKMIILVSKKQPKRKRN